MTETDKLLEQIRSTGGVEIMKASAGSGKTFSLAREYIRLLLGSREPDAHRHILAVTFTNKATGEMKSRIIEELDTLARYADKSPYKDFLMEHCGFTSLQELSNRSRKALEAILEDYGAFSVSTIDKFFQKVLRAFAREIGQNAEYQIELDKDSLVTEAVDSLLDSISPENKELLRWISDCALDRVEEGEGYNLEGSVREFADGYLSEGFRSKEARLGIDEKKAFSKENVRKLQAICKQVKEKFEEEFRKAAGDVLDVIDGLPGGTVSSNFRNRIVALKEEGADAIKMNWYTKDEAPDYWKNALADGSGALSAAGRKKVPESTRAEVCSRLRTLEALHYKPLCEYRTADILRRQVSIFHLADALDKSFKSVLGEKKVLSIDETNAILRDIIDGTDTPFIYEKVGVRYAHFLLDEFQDTSLIQWDNFRPLLLNSISDGCYNLIVGDVKQSIYRWRNAEWKILDEEVEKTLGRTIVNPLDKNWRSAPGIIRFNNAFYARLTGEMDRQLGIADGERKIAGIYSDVKQEENGKFDIPGSVEMTFCDKDEVYDRTTGAVLAAIDRGFALKDIAVLVRRNSVGAEVAQRLSAEHIDVVTNDSLRIGSSPVVRRLVARMTMKDNPKDAIGTYEAGEGFDVEGVDRCQSLIDMAETLVRQMDRDEVNGDTPYLLAFMDLIRDYVDKNGNSLHGFLKFWKEEGSDKSISSPQGRDAVTIITVHKAKGLAFPFVVIPIPDNNSFANLWNPVWACPDMEGTSFGNVEKAMYRVKLSSSSLQTLFSRNYIDEKKMESIDSANVWYVATTRAAEAMHIVAPIPKDGGVAGGPWPETKDIVTAFHLFANDPDNGFTLDEPEPAGDEGEEVPVCEHYVFGELCPKAVRGPQGWSKPEMASRGEVLEYLGDGSEETSRGKVVVRSDAKDFFSDGNGTGVQASARIKGVVLHRILESVMGPEDLHASVEKAVEDGQLGREQAEEAESMLAGAIASVADRGWFPGDPRRILDEREIFTAEGEELTLRPDRVVIDGDSVQIVDYKFGAPKRSHVRQVAGYMRLYRAMGWNKVAGFIWYVEAGDVVSVEEDPYLF